MLNVETMRWGRGVVGLTFVTLWMGCSSFDAAEAERERARNEAADGGPGGSTPVTGSALGTYDVTVDVPALRHGRAVSAQVAITRSPQFPRELRVDLKDPPTGVTAEEITLAPDAATGELKITADASVPQGPIKLTVRINATGTPLDDVLLPKDVAVQGAPGELDTSFGTNGVFATPEVGNAGRIYLGTPGKFYLSIPPGSRGASKLALYTADPAARDLSFGTDGGLKLSSNLQQTLDGLIEVGNTALQITPVFSPAQARISRRLLDGTPDPNFSFSDNGMTASSVAFRARDGRMAVLGSDNAQDSARVWKIDWLDSSGGLDTTVNATGRSIGATALSLRHSSHTMDAVYASDGAHIFRFLRAGGGLDAGFANAGTLDVPGGGVIIQTTTDAQDRLFAAGRDSNGALFMMRLVGRQLDPQWDAKGYNAFSASSSTDGSFVLLADGRTFQVGTFAGGESTRCAVFARRPDGALDSTFGTNGVATLPVENCSAVDVALFGGEKLLISGPKTLRVWL